MKEQNGATHTWVALLSLGVAVVLLCLKFWAYAATGSQAVFGDALESIVNVVAAAFAFGVLRALGFPLQIADVSVAPDFLAMIPFIAAYVVVIVVSASPQRARRVAAPAALGVPYSREAR